jgi:hypothetical protein
MKKKQGENGVIYNNDRTFESTRRRTGNNAILLQKETAVTKCKVLTYIDTSKYMGK